MDEEDSVKKVESGDKQEIVGSGGGFRKEAFESRY